MRRGLPVALAVAGLLGSAGAALALPHAAGDGTLVVKNASGTATVAVRGGAIGRCVCRLVIDDPVPDDGTGPIVSGTIDLTRQLTETKTLYVGELRFRIIGGFFRIVAKGQAVNLSVVGTGTLTLIGASSLDDGSFSVNDDGFDSLPDLLTRWQLDASARNDTGLVLPPAA